MNRRALLSRLRAGVWAIVSAVSWYAIWRCINHPSPSVGAVASIVGCVWLAWWTVVMLPLPGTR